MPSSRRQFMSAVSGFAAIGSLTQAETLGEEPVPTAPSDLPRELPTTGANLGSLHSIVQQLAESRQFEFSFLADRFRTLDEFKRAGRESCLKRLPIDRRQ